MIGQLNRRITIKTSTYNQDAGGGVSVDETDSYTMWAKIDARNGFPVTGEEQQVWNYDYKVKVRYERSRVIKSNQTVEFDGMDHSINSISFENEGRRRYTILRCATVDNNVTTDNGS